jgi:hypothetical protein
MGMQLDGECCESREIACGCVPRDTPLRDDATTQRKQSDTELTLTLFFGTQCQDKKLNRRDREMKLDAMADRG